MAFIALKSYNSMITEEKAGLHGFFKFFTVINFFPCFTFLHTQTCFLTTPDQVGRGNPVFIIWIINNKNLKF